MSETRNLCNTFIYYTFMHSGFHQEPFIAVKDVFAIAQFHDRNGNRKVIRARNTCSAHAEENLICRLTCYLKVKNLPSQTIGIYINFSPCWACSQKLLAFKTLAKASYGMDFKMAIRFSSLYRIQRPSRINQHRNMDDEKRIFHLRNLCGLRSLAEDEHELRTFCDDDWLFLARYLQVPYDVPSARKREDALLKRDFQKLREHWG